MLQHLLADFPPNVVRFLARSGIGRGTHQLTDEEVAARAGLPRKAVSRIGRSTSWEDIPIGMADQFMVGCGFNIKRRHLQRRFLRRALMSNLRFCAAVNPRRRRDLPSPEALTRAAAPVA